MTEAELNARRENAKHSSGPTTEAGKKRSSLNAFRHGLTGQIVVQTPEDQEAFNKHCEGIREDLAPEGALETTLAQAIAEDYWRLNRVRALENGIFALGQTEHVPEGSEQPELDDALSPARTWMAHARELQLLSLYESRISRSVEKKMAQFLALQDLREPDIDQEPPARPFTVQSIGRKGTDDDPAGGPAPENPDSSVRFFERTANALCALTNEGDPASNQSDPASNQSDPASNQPDPAQPAPQQTAPRPEPPAEARETKKANPPQPTRQPTMQDVYDIIGWHPIGWHSGDTERRPGDEWERNPIGQVVWHR
jgi:hypothetical protein